MNGLLLVDKQEGWTSHDVVAKLRGILREPRIGHAGTLDPLATGLLVVLLGRATRACRFAEAEEKEYIVSFRPGVTTDTQDISGTVLSDSGRRPSAEQLCAMLPGFLGELSQIPPMYSAIKVGGKKLYELARRGESIARNPRRVSVFSLDYLGENEGDFILRVRCSKGTYIRTLCHDIGLALGCGGCMAGLRRISSGPFTVMDAYLVGEIDREAATGDPSSLLLPTETLFLRYPVLSLTAEQERRCRAGNSFPVDAEDGEVRLQSVQGDFLALGRVLAGKAEIIKSFFEVT